MPPLSIVSANRARRRPAPASATATRPHRRGQTPSSRLVPQLPLTSLRHRHSTTTSPGGRPSRRKSVRSGKPRRFRSYSVCEWPHATGLWRAEVFPEPDSPLPNGYPARCRTKSSPFREMLREGSCACCHRESKLKGVEARAATVAALAMPQSCPRCRRRPSRRRAIRCRARSRREPSASTRPVGRDTSNR